MAHTDKTFMNSVSRALLAWHAISARALPWVGERDPYRVWLSEIMLQQTQVKTASPYYMKFILRYPTVHDLAGAPEDDVLKSWEGLGYYSRARNMHRAARMVSGALGGEFPRDAAGLRALPGVGEYTAGAVASMAFGERTPALDGNAVRVLTRVFGVRERADSGEARQTLHGLAMGMLEGCDPGMLNQALMGLGAMVCKPNPRCEECPLMTLCDARAVGDMRELPVKPPRAKPVEIERGIALVLGGGGVLMTRREGRMLGGLWEFPGFDDARSAGAVAECLAEQGINARFEGMLPDARHVFTHRVWNMRGYRFASLGDPPPGFIWADARALKDLAIPTALRAYRKLALSILEGKAGGGRP